MLSTLVGLAFLEIYIGRIGRSPLFAFMAALLSGTLLGFFAVVVVRIVQRATSSPATGHSAS